MPFYKLAYYVLFVNTCLDVLLGDHLGSQVAVKVLKDKSMVQQFLSEAYVMTYAAVMFTVLVVLVEHSICLIRALRKSYFMITTCNVCYVDRN